LTSENGVFGGHLTLPKHEIVDCGAFCKVIFFLHLAQGSAWGLFLQAQRHASPAAESRPVDAMVRSMLLISFMTIFTNILVKDLRIIPFLT
jgi:hypothetical protein